MNAKTIVQKWNEAEPIRLYVYGLVAPAIALLIALDTLKPERATALLALLAAVLVPGVEIARAKVVSPATMRRLTTRRPPSHRG